LLNVAECPVVVAAAKLPAKTVYGKKVHGKNGHGKIGHKWKKGPRIFGPRGIKVHGVSIPKHTDTVKRSTKGGKKDHGSMFYVCLYDMLFQDACTG